MTAPAVIDAGVLIALLDPADAHHDWSVRTLRSLGPGRLTVSALTLAEAIVHPAMAGVVPAALASLTRLGISVLAVAEADVLPLAELRASSRLRMPPYCTPRSRRVQPWRRPTAGWRERHPPPGSPSTNSTRSRDGVRLVIDVRNAFEHVARIKTSLALVDVLEEVAVDCAEMVRAVGAIGSS